MLLGYLLLFAGTIVASLGGARLPEADRLLSLIGLGMLLASAVVMRAARATVITGPAQVEAVPGADLRALLKGLYPELVALQARASSISLATYLRHLEELEQSYLRPLSDGFPSLLSSMGPERFAQVAGAYASGERFLARSWSAAADNHRPEAVASLERAVARVEEAIEGFERVSV